MENITKQLGRVRISNTKIGWSNSAGQNLKKVQEIPSRKTYNYMKEQAAASMASQGAIGAPQQQWKGRKSRRSTRKSRRTSRKAQTRRRR